MKKLNCSILLMHVFFIFIFTSSAYSSDTDQKSVGFQHAETPPLPEQAKRLGIEKPTKSTKFETVKSECYDEEYDIAIDEDAAREAGFTKKEIEESLKKAMDSREDRRENGAIEIEIEEPEKNPEKPDAPKEPKKKFVGKIQKRELPKSAHQDSRKPAEKKFTQDNGKTLIIRASGACESQNKGLVESVRFEMIV